MTTTRNDFIKLTDKTGYFFVNKNHIVAILVADDQESKNGDLTRIYATDGTDQPYWCKESMEQVLHLIGIQT